MREQKIAARKKIFQTEKDEMIRIIQKLKSKAESEEFEESSPCIKPADFLSQKRQKLIAALHPPNPDRSFMKDFPEEGWFSEEMFNGHETPHSE